MTNRQSGSRPSGTQATTQARNSRAWLIAALVSGVLLVCAVGLWLGEERAGQSEAVAVSQSAAVAGPAAGSSAPVQRIKDLSQLPPGQVEHIQVAYFHRTQRCEGCIKAEQLTRKALETYFVDRLKSGEISLVVADVQKPQNAALAQKYGAWSSSLYLGILKGGVEYTWPVNDIWFTLNSEARFMASLRNTLNTVYGGH